MSSNREEILDLKSQIAELRAYVQQQEARLFETDQTRIRLVRNEGEEQQGFQPFIFLTPNGDDRGTQFESAQMLSTEQFLAFYQDGRWHGCRCGTPADPVEISNCAHCTGGESPNPVRITLELVNNLQIGSLDYGVDWAGMVTKEHEFSEVGGCTYSAPQIESETTLAVGNVSAGNDARARLNFQWVQHPLGTNLIGYCEIWFEVQQDGGFWRAATGGGQGSLILITAGLATPPALIDCFAEHAFSGEFVDQYGLTDFVSGTIEATPTPPPPDPPPAYQFATKALLTAADPTDYLVGDQVQVTADGVNNGFYLAIGITGGPPAAWFFLANVTPGGIGQMQIKTTFKVGGP